MGTGLSGKHERGEWGVLRLDEWEKVLGVWEGEGEKGWGGRLDKWEG